MESTPIEPCCQLPAVPNLAIPAEIARELPEAVRLELAALPAMQQQAFAGHYQKECKSLAMAYLVSLIYCHYALLGRWTMTGFMLVSLFLAAAIGSVWWIIDLFRMPALVREHNGKVATEVLGRLRSAADFAGRLPAA